MELWKWALSLAAAALLGLLVLFGAAPRQAPQGVPPATTASPVESGAFALVRGGVALAREDFLLSTGGPQVDLHSTVTYTAAGGGRRFTQRYRLSADLHPVRYLRGASADEATNTVLVEVEAEQVRVNRFSGGQAIERTFDGDEPYAILDEDVFSHYLILHRRLLHEPGAFAGTAVLPQTLETVALRAQAPQPATLTSAGRVLEVVRRDVTVGQTAVRLYAQNGVLVAVVLSEQDELAYRADLLPDGVRESAR